MDKTDSSCKTADSTGKTDKISVLVVCPALKMTGQTGLKWAAGVYEMRSWAFM